LYLHSPGLSPIPTRALQAGDTPDQVSRQQQSNPAARNSRSSGNASGIGPGRGHGSAGDVNSNYGGGSDSGSKPRARTMSAQSDVSLHLLDGVGDASSSRSSDIAETAADARSGKGRDVEVQVDVPDTPIAGSGRTNKSVSAGASAGVAGVNSNNNHDGNNHADVAAGAPAEDEEQEQEQEQEEEEEEEEEYKLVSVLELDVTAQAHGDGDNSAARKADATDSDGAQLYSMHMLAEHSALYGSPMGGGAGGRVYGNTRSGGGGELDLDSSLQSMSVLHADTPQSVLRISRTHQHQHQHQHRPNKAQRTTPSPGSGNTHTHMRTHTGYMTGNANENFQNPFVKPIGIGNAYSIVLDAQGSPMLVPLRPMSIETPGSAGGTIGMGMGMGRGYPSYQSPQDRLQQGDWYNQGTGTDPYTSNDLRGKYNMLSAPKPQRSSVYWKDRLSRRGLSSVMRSPLIDKY